MSKDHWNKSFSEKDYVYGETENTFINEMSYRIPEYSKVACFAEGEGRNAVYLAKLGHDVTAYDQSVIGLEKANELANKNKVNIQTKEIDLTTEKVKAEQYDASILVFGHVPKKDQSFLMENMIESVKPGGYILFEVYPETQLEYGTGGPKSKELLYNPIDILQWKEDYKVVHFYYGEVERNEGKRHQGLCHVIQVGIKK